MAYITMADLAGLESNNGVRRRPRPGWGLGQAAAPPATAPVAPPAPPVVTSIMPTSGGAGLYVTITGMNLVGATSVTFNGVAAAFVVNSPTQITATTPQGVATGPVVVTTPAGSVTAPNPFTAILPPPTITQMSAASGAPGDYVTIFGANFTGTTAVAFNGVPAQSFVVNSSGQITAQVPGGATAGPVSITTPGGSTLSSSTFTVASASGSVPAGLLVQQAVDTIVRQRGLRDDVGQSYTADVLYAIRDNALSRGVDPSRVSSLVRQEVYRRVLQSDPSPSGDLIDLAARLSGQYQQQPAYQPAPVQQPMPAPAPAYAPPAATSPEEAPAPAPSRSRGRGQRSERPMKDQYPAWVVPAAAAAGGALLILLAMNASRR